MSEKCNGVQQCQKDAEIRAARAELRGGVIRGKTETLGCQPTPFAGETSARYGDATGQVVGLDAFLPGLRTFTKSEVLTVLRALKADTGVVAGKEALERAVRVFEGMEASR
jgi:hypothetical protein